MKTISLILLLLSSVCFADETTVVHLTDGEAAIYEAIIDLDETVQKLLNDRVQVSTDAKPKLITDAVETGDPIWDYAVETGDPIWDYAVETTTLSPYEEGFNSALLCMALLNLELNIKGERKTWREMGEICRKRNNVRGEK